MADRIKLNITMRSNLFLSAAGIALTAVAMALLTAPATVRAEPRLTAAEPAYGDVLEALPEILHLCFSEAVKTEDTSDFRFNVVNPKGGALGIRIVFDTSGECVDVYPGIPEDPPEGIWSFDWMVRAQADDSEGSGSVKFQMGELQPGETPLDRPKSESIEGGEGGASTVLLIAIGAGVALIIVATAGFIVSRRRRS
ncbi:MAG TPA: hypothetical protein VFP63_05540 [Dehalococcoidia bacterium]|nr:hypothetical protein [Dehalococcoidia bacterium]